MQKAEGDYIQATQNYRSANPVYDGVCFHCQQCAEKSLKALLEELGLSVPKTHDLDGILRLLLPHHPTLRSVRRGLGSLTPFPVNARYPGKKASKRQAEAALHRADKVRTRARVILGIRPPRPRRKKSP